jgi:hypothetical protein
MNCIAPEEIREGDLLAFIEGHATPQVKEHVARCPFCAAEAVALAKADRVLSTALYRAPCPATEALVQYQAGLLKMHERRQIARHIQECSFCAGELRRLSTLDAPQYSLWEEMRRAARTVIEAVHVPPPARLAAAVRGGRFSPRLYRAGELDIVLGSEMLSPTCDLWRLRGRITRGGLAMTNLTGSTVRLIQEGRIVASQAIDDMGYFSCEHLAAGQYDLWLERPEADIVVRQVVVGAMMADADEEETRA